MDGRVPRRVMTKTIRIQSRLRSSVGGAGGRESEILSHGSKIKIDTKGRTLDASGAVADACGPAHSV